MVNERNTISFRLPHVSINTYMTQNIFTKKMINKSSGELKSIIKEDSGFVEEAKEAALIELTSRNDDGTLELEKVEKKHRALKGENRYQDFIKSIDTEIHFGWTPEHKETTNSNVPFELINVIVEQAVSKLGWDLVFQTTDSVEIKRIVDGNWTEKLTLEISKKGELTINSKSLGSGMLDMGRNSKWVKLLIHVIHEVESEYDSDSLEQLAIDTKKKENMDDYVVPDSLSKPESFKTPEIWSPIIGALIGTTVLAAIFAIFTKYFYIMLLFETGIGLGLAIVVFQSCKYGNYTHYINTRVIMGFSVVGIVFLTQFFQYSMVIYEHSAFEVTFLQFMELRFEQGFTFQDLNLGWIGLLAMFSVQLFVIYYVCWARLSTFLATFQMERVPEDVIEFAVYQLVKGKTEIGLKNELAKKGWSENSHQEYVLEALGANHGIQEFNRSE